MTISVTPIIPTPPANLDKMASTNTPEVPFGNVLSKEVAAHQASKSTTKTDVQTKKTNDAPDASVVEANTPPAQLTTEILAIMGQVPVNGVANETNRAAQPSSLGDVGKNINTTTRNVVDVLAKPTEQSAKDGNPRVALLDLASSDTPSNKVGNKMDAGNFTELLKGAETDRARAAAISLDTPPTLPTQTTTVNLALQNPAMMLTDKLAARVGTPAWEQSFSQKVVWMANGAQQIASLTLNPPDLGPLQIVLSVNNDQANATFIAAQPEVRLAIEAAMPKLREMMSDAGIQLGQANVSAGDPRQQNTAQQDSASRQNTGGNLSVDTTFLNNAPVTTKITTGLGLINTFV